MNGGLSETTGWSPQRTAERAELHVQMVRAEGGFGRMERLGDRVVYVDAEGAPWRHVRDGQMQASRAAGAARALAAAERHRLKAAAQAEAKAARDAAAEQDRQRRKDERSAERQREKRKAARAIRRTKKVARPRVRTINPALPPGTRSARSFAPQPGGKLQRAVLEILTDTPQSVTGIAVALQLCSQHTMQALKGLERRCLAKRCSEAGRLVWSRAAQAQAVAS
jgi:hypothetical protein